jgi:hypothetical protein
MRIRRQYGQDFAMRGQNCAAGGKLPWRLLVGVAASRNNAGSEERYSRHANHTSLEG